MAFKILFVSCLLFIATIDARRSRMIGGANAEISHFPYHAALRRTTDSEIICGGAIISSRHILTTADCVNFVPMEYMKVCVGRATEGNIFGATYYPEYIITHPAYTGHVNKLYQKHFDISVIVLNQTIIYNEYTMKVYLPNREVMTGDLGVISSWGAISYPVMQFPTTLQTSWMTVLDLETCSQKIQFQLLFDQFCAYRKPGVGMCRGDGGNPLISNNRIIGLFIASKDYGSGDPEIYINVYSHLEFVRSIIRGGYFMGNN